MPKPCLSTKLVEIKENREGCKRGEKVQEGTQGTSIDMWGEKMCEEESRDALLLRYSRFHLQQHGGEGKNGISCQHMSTPPEPLFSFCYQCFYTNACPFRVMKYISTQLCPSNQCVAGWKITRVCRWVSMPFILMNNITAWRCVRFWWIVLLNDSKRIGKTLTTMKNNVRNEHIWWKICFFQNVEHDRTFTFLCKTKACDVCVCQD